MNGFVVEPEDMNRATMIDEKLDALLAGRAAAGDELAAELSLMLEQIGEAFPVPVISEEVEEAHVAKIMHATGAAPESATAPVGRNRPQMFARIRAAGSQRIAAATLAVSTVFGGAAYAGVLPAPVQRAVANAAAIIGLQLPNPDHGRAERRSPGGAAGDGRDHPGQSTNRGSESGYRRTRDEAGPRVHGEVGDGRSGSAASSLDREPRDGRDERAREWRDDDGDGRDDDGHGSGKSNDDDDGETNDVGDGDEPDDAAPDEDDDGEDEPEESSRSGADDVDAEESGDE